MLPIKGDPRELDVSSNPSVTSATSPRYTGFPFATPTMAFFTSLAFSKNPPVSSASSAPLLEVARKEIRVRDRDCLRDLERRQAVAGDPLRVQRHAHLAASAADDQGIAHARHLSEFVEHMIRHEP